MRGLMLVVTASEDQMMPLEFGEQLMKARYGALAESMSESRLVRLAGTTHYSSLAEV